MTSALHTEGLLPHDARALRLFDDRTRRGAEESFDVKRAATAVVAANGLSGVATTTRVGGLSPRPDPSGAGPPV